MKKTKQKSLSDNFNNILIGSLIMAVVLLVLETIGIIVIKVFHIETFSVYAPDAFRVIIVNILYGILTLLILGIIIFIAELIGEAWREE